MKIYKEQVIVIVVLLSILIMWIIAMNNPEPPTLPWWEDPDFEQPPWFEPYQ